MIKIKQFKYSRDNFGYIVYNKTKAIAIDGGDTGGMLTFLEKNHLSLKTVTNTHAHQYHTQGNKYLLQATKAALLDTGMLKKTATIMLDHEEITIIHTPGHTADSFTFYTEGTLITGDTLFNGTVGNCFSGDMTGFLISLNRLMVFPDDTIIYSGHDYVQDSMTYAGIIEPYNTKKISEYLARYNPDHVYSTLGDEKKVNPYVRYNNKDMIRNLANRNLPAETETERWESVMSIG